MTNSQATFSLLTLLYTLKNLNFSKKFLKPLRLFPNILQSSKTCQSPKLFSIKLYPPILSLPSLTLIANIICSDLPVLYVRAWSVWMTDFLVKKGFWIEIGLSGCQVTVRDEFLIHSNFYLEPFWSFYVSMGGFWGFCSE